MYIAIIDDSDEDIGKIAEAVSSYYSSQKVNTDIIPFSSGESFLQQYIPEQFDLIFLDIYMNGMTGMAVAEKIREANDSCPLIFITSSDSYAVASYEVQATYYLMKPFQPEKLKQILGTIDIKKSQDKEFIEVISNRFPVQIPVKNILYVDTYHNAVQIHTNIGLIRSYITFQKFEELIQGKSCFLSCYRGCIVNMDHIQKATEDGFLMDNKELVIIRKRGSNSIKKAYLQYLFSSNSK